MIDIDSVWHELTPAWVDPVRRVLRRSVRVTRVDPPSPGARIEHVTVTNMQGEPVRRRIVLSTLAEDWHSRFTQQLPQEKTNHGHQ